MSVTDLIIDNGPQHWHRKDGQCIAHQAGDQSLAHFHFVANQVMRIALMYSDYTHSMPSCLLYALSITITFRKQSSLYAVTTSVR